MLQKLCSKSGNMNGGPTQERKICHRKLNLPILKANTTLQTAQGQWGTVWVTSAMQNRHSYVGEFRQSFLSNSKDPITCPCVNETIQTIERILHECTKYSQYSLANDNMNNDPRHQYGDPGPDSIPPEINGLHKNRRKDITLSSPNPGSRTRSRIRRRNTRSRRRLIH